ncbi:MAG: polyprenyl diphosphate synthase [Bacteroidetes bacterium]|nr:polyprenyl diphosphate synthase [Bacteroidota bacterium]
MADSLHVAIIMDGNGRWANERNLPRSAGHHAGIRSLRETVEVAVQRQIHTLTLYAFSSDNWQRPHSEVQALMRILAAQLPAQAAHCVRQNIRLSVIGRRDRLPAPVLQALIRAEARTIHGSALHLRLALDYSARDSLTRAAEHVGSNGNGDFMHALMRAYNADCPVPDVDLLIRTGGEQRLSDFLLWECAYAELYFTAEYWPDFNGMKLDEALAAFQKRQRRYGAVPVG